MLSAVDSIIRIILLSAEDIIDWMILLLSAVDNSILCYLQYIALFEIAINSG